MTKLERMQTGGGLPSCERATHPGPESTGKSREMQDCTRPPPPDAPSPLACAASPVRSVTSRHGLTGVLLASVYREAHMALLRLVGLGNSIAVVS